MGLPTRPEKMPPERGWEILPVFSANAFSPNYVLALEEMSSDPELPGHSDVGVRNLLFTWILSLRPQAVLELGGHIGSAAIVMGEALRLNGYGTLHTLEPQEHYFQRLNHYVEKAGLRGIVVPIRGFSYEVAIKQRLCDTGPFELIFIDACHDYSAVINELVFCTTLLAQHGFIFLHDSSVYAQSFDSRAEGGVRRAILECCKNDPTLKAVFFEYPLWLNPCGAAILCKQDIIDRSKKLRNFLSLISGRKQT